MNRIGIRTLILCSLAISFLATAASAQVTTVIRRVRLDQTSSFSSQDGQSWGTAFKYLQDAIDDSVAYHQGGSGQQDHIVQIWVKGGTGTTFTYIPNIDGDFDHLAGQDESFFLWNNTELYGGFNGTETAEAQRDPAVNVTVLSGDNLGNDSIAHFDAGTFTHDSFEDNSYHVVRGLSLTDSSAVIDGFTITGGFAWLTLTPTIEASNGGGILITPTLPDPEPTNGPDSAPIVRNCKLERNYSEQNGGGMYVGPYPTSEVHNCTFFKNYADAAGGLFNFASHMLAVGNTFTDNYADGQAGGMYVANGNCQIINSQFIDNHIASDGTGVADGGGLAIIMQTGGAAANGTEITNCVFRDNTADRDGAGLWGYVEETGTVKIQNCTFYANIASGDGGGIALDVPGLGGTSYIVALQNCILWDNIGDGTTLEAQVKKLGTLRLNVEYSDVEGWCTYGPGVSCTSGVDSTNHNLDLDPAFKDTDNMALQNGSPCIEKGSNSLLPLDTADLGGTPGTADELPVDIVGTDRTKDADFTGGAVVDMGAYEWDPGCAADFTGTDCTVGSFDLAILLGQWGPCEDCDEDLNSDNVVNGFDLAILLTFWGPCPTGSCEESLMGGGGEEQSQESEQEDPYPMLAWWFFTGDYAALFDWAGGQ